MEHGAQISKNVGNLQSEIDPRVMNMKQIDSKDITDLFCHWNKKDNIKLATCQAFKERFRSLINAS